MLFLQQKLRDNARHMPPSGQRRSRNFAHQAEAPAAIDEPDPARRK
jgi:hypothetical protein